MFTDEDKAVGGGSWVASLGWAWALLNHRGTESKEKAEEGLGWFGLIRAVWGGMTLDRLK